LISHLTDCAPLRLGSPRSYSSKQTSTNGSLRPRSQANSLALLIGLSENLHDHTSFSLMLHLHSPFTILETVRVAGALKSSLLHIPPKNQ